MDQDDDDEDNKPVSFCLFVGCNLDQGRPIQKEEHEAYFSENTSKVSYKLVSVDMSEQSITAVARDIVEHLNNQVLPTRMLRPFQSQDTIDSPTNPPCTPIENIKPEWFQPVNAAESDNEWVKLSHFPQNLHTKIENLLLYHFISLFYSFACPSELHDYKFINYAKKFYAYITFEKNLHSKL